MKYSQTYKFVNPELPYGYGALEPFIDEKTMKIHHDRHLQTYVDNLNNTLEKYDCYHDWTLEELICCENRLPAEIQKAVHNNAGGVYNHIFYFDGMTGEDIDMRTDVSECIIVNFGTIEEFKSEMKKAALSVFGSGYAWLVLDSCCKLQIVTTANQDTVLTCKLAPILNIDVWEHAYYLKHYNKRVDYIDDWFNVINWDVVGERLRCACDLQG